MTSDSYNFASTLAIEMYLGKHDAYSILNTSQACWAAAILPCCDREATSGGGTKSSCKQNFTVNIDVDLYTLWLLILPKTCSKVSNSVFATHCTVHALDVVHTDYGVKYSRYFRNSRSYPIHLFLIDRQKCTNITGNWHTYLQLQV